MTTLDLEAWIDTVQAKLNERMSNRYPDPSEAVAIAYHHQQSTARATSVPRVEWSVAPKWAATLSIDRQLKGGPDGLGLCRYTVRVACIAANLDDCRALLVNLLQAMLAVTNAKNLAWPIKGAQAAKDVSQDGRLSQKIELELGVDFTIPSDPQDIGSWSPTGPTVEETVEQFDVTGAGDPWSQT